MSTVLEFVALASALGAGLAVLVMAAVESGDPE